MSDYKKGLIRKNKLGEEISVRLCVTLSTETYARFDEYIEKSGFNRSKLIENLLNLYLDKAELKRS